MQGQSESEELLQVFVCSEMFVCLPDSVSAFECCFCLSVSRNMYLEYIPDNLGFFCGSFQLNPFVGIMSVCVCLCVHSV